MWVMLDSPFGQTTHSLSRLPLGSGPHGDGHCRHIAPGFESASSSTN